MEVKPWHGGGSTYGISVGKANRDEFFLKHWDHIFVEVEGRVIRFELTPSFWRECPEFRDSGHSTIRDWLQKHKSLTWSERQKPRAKLTPLGGRKFRLEP